MPDQDTFIRAINARPDDDGPRLVYADWLEERGECDRAELIRLQIEMAQLNERDRPDRAPELSDRIDELLRIHLDEWEPKFQSAAWFNESCPVIFSRGFPALRISVETLVELADQLHDACPVTAVSLIANSTESRIENLSPLIARLVTNPVLSKVVTIELGLNDLDVRLLINSPYLGSLSILTVLPGSGLSSRGVEYLADSPGARAIKELGLRRLALTSEAAVALALSPYLNALKVLDLHRNLIGNQGASALAKSTRLSGLKSLNLEANRIGSRGAQSLAESQNLQSIERIELRYNVFWSKDMALLRNAFGERAVL
jgi:uncharacterized protein (TIGR02996 family)